MQHRRTSAVALATASLAAAALAAAGMASASPPPASASTTGRVVISDTAPGALAANAKVLAPGARVGVSVFIGRNQAGLAATAAAVSTPDSALYSHFLTPAQVSARFGATSTQRAAVVGWLTGAGLTVNHNAPFIVSAHGTAAEAAAALHASPELVPARSGTPAQVVPSRAVSVPAALGALVSTVTLRGGAAPMGHHQPLPAVHGVVPGSAAAKTEAGSCSSYYGELKAKGTPKAYGQVQTWAVCGYLPSQIRGAYGVTASTLTGKGVSVAVLSEDNDSTGEADADMWATNRGEPKFKNGQYQALIGGSVPNGIGDVESALDIESVHGMAPAAKVVYSVADGQVTGSRLLDAFNQVVTGGAAQVVTSSWYEGYMTGVPQSLIDAWEAVLKQATAQGIGVDFATGDFGDDTPLQYPGSDPMITTVGGTSLAIGATDNYLWETAWASDETSLSQDGKSWDPAPPGSFAEGGTGGVSQTFREPKYQEGIVKHNVVGGHKMRVVPDISALGDWNLGYQIGYTNHVGGSYVEGVNGGTSLSSPLFAGMQADVIQARGGTPLGFANPALYALYGSDAFNDVVHHPAGASHLAVVYGPAYSAPPTLSSMGRCGTTHALTCGKGYDTIDGLGSPAPGFFSAFNG